MVDRAVRLPILALFLISLGGLLLHIRIHPTSVTAFNWVPIVCGVLTTLALPVLFAFRSTVAWAYLLNVAVVLIGTVTMAYFSAEIVVKSPAPVTWQALLLHTTLPDILVLLAKLPLGHVILRHFRPAGREGGAA